MPLLPTLQLFLERLLPLLHGPTVIGRKDGLQKKRQAPEQWFLGLDSPVVRDIDVAAILSECPHARAVEIAPGFEDAAIQLSAAAIVSYKEVDPS